MSFLEPGQLLASAPRATTATKGSEKDSASGLTKGEFRRIIDSCAAGLAPAVPFSSKEPDDVADSTDSGEWETIYNAFNKGTTVFTRRLRSYIIKTRLRATLHQEMSFMKVHTNPDIRDVYVRNLQSLLSALEARIKRVRAKCLAEGHDLHSIDSIIISCKLHDPDTGLLIPLQNGAARHTDLLALRRKSLKLDRSILNPETNSTWTSKLDRINSWLFHNLQNLPENAALHRSMLPNDDTLDEKAWARSVIKYWSIDSAGMGWEHSPESSRDAIGSWDTRGRENGRRSRRRSRGMLELTTREKKFVLPALLARVADERFVRARICSDIAAVAIPVSCIKDVGIESFAAAQLRKVLGTFVSD
jgi:hypothetical protein